MSGCNCLCAAWGHRGICAGQATETLVIASPVAGRVPTSMCAPCAAAVREESARRRAAQAGRPAAEEGAP